MIPDFRGVAFLAYVGLVSIFLSVVAAIIGIPILIWWLIHHVAFV